MKTQKTIEIGIKNYLFCGKSLSNGVEVKFSFILKLGRGKVSKQNQLRVSLVVLLVVILVGAVLTGFDFVENLLMSGLE